MKRLPPLRPPSRPTPTPSHLPPPPTYATNHIRPAPKPGQTLPKRQPAYPPPPLSPTTSTASPIPSASPTLSSTSSALKEQWRPLGPRARAALPFLLSLVVGLGVTTYFTSVWLAAPPEPGSEGDRKELARLEKAVDELFLVKVYRGKCVAAGRAIRGEGGGDWRELEMRRGDAEGPVGGGAETIGKVRSAELRFEAEKRANAAVVEEREREIVAMGGVNLGNKGGREERLEGLRQQAQALGLEVDFGDTGEGKGDGRFGGGVVEGALGGSRGLAVQRVFWNRKETELVAVVYLGKGLCGWPNTVHGGFLATLMGEKLGMAAGLFRTEVVPSAKLREGGKGKGEEGDWRELAELEIQYRKPTYAGQFYVVRALPRVGEDGKGVEIEGTLETLEGKVTVQVNGRAPVEVAAPALVSSGGWLNGLLKWLR
ncbi:hypothetical protein KVT40_000271 [Elsinoe batatas]|uniref:Thioesterase domain-containing protein n=1 Tax=Elsinoe batatas TaxID=2601811 RepID=A0A8K0LB37_9PEZI|nr:hypothetical protein KVT40_000271 [Elsinoe batatas]